MFLWLVVGAIYFTFRMRFINLRGFKHAIDLIRGRFDNPNDKGEVSHFQALTTALSATVGLGNIASVAVAITIGGPGATFLDDSRRFPRNVHQIHRVYSRSEISRNR